MGVLWDGTSNLNLCELNAHKKNCSLCLYVVEGTAGFKSVWIALLSCVCDGDGQGLIRAFTLNVVNCPVRLSRRCRLD